jgi:hypothetical protein
MIVFLDIAPRSLVETYRRFRAAHYLYPQRTSETPVYFETTRLCIFILAAASTWDLT